ncbi:MAG: hypothetical protein K2N76_05935 [Muribaculaceae bacterium]|nr:hypothetical protein [Muribaculaceae bacterium]
MLRLLILTIVALTLGGCATTRRQSALKAESLSASSLDGVAVSADVREARLEGVEIIMADTTVRIGRVTLSRMQTGVVSVSADSLCSSHAESDSISESVPVSRPVVTHWLLLILVALLWLCLNRKS